MAVEVRRRTLILDNLTTTKAVDALLNAETVALFNNRCVVALGGVGLTGARIMALTLLFTTSLLNPSNSYTPPFPPQNKINTQRDLEVHQYDHYLRGFQQAAIQTEQLAATLNAGQAVVLSTGLTLVLISAVVGGSGGGLFGGAVATARPFSPGDLVLLQGLLLQLWSPLQYLGWFWR
jgi:ABC-type transport system involved in Fe-S cluster assembly fused permease/ATPase subunit